LLQHPMHLRPLQPLFGKLRICLCFAATDGARGCCGEGLGPSIGNVPWTLRRPFSQCALRGRHIPRGRASFQDGRQGLGLARAGPLAARRRPCFRNRISRIFLRPTIFSHALICFVDECAYEKCTDGRSGASTAAGGGGPRGGTPVAQGDGGALRHSPAVRSSRIHHCLCFWTPETM